ncbi:hypothetical protein [uncultured Roseibium sp.]|uniref:hypothetical protein n=1 Tax=uncultured Roseibium sp. TaxID=1936171 RepID=UPI002629C9FE|nr:hypothetical protein [uncultured Roseibium sp.]
MPTKERAGGEDLSCPSSQPTSAGARVIGLVEHENGEPRIAYLNGDQPVTPELLEMAAPLEPTTVFRFGAACETSSCVHFGNGNCQLAKRILTGLEEVVDSLPPCVLRKSCRWYAQEGAAMCRRCPQIVTTSSGQDETIKAVADG